MKTINLLAIPGSLRRNSASNAILKFIAGELSETISFVIYDKLAGIPPFDDSDVVPTAVQEFRQLIEKSDGVLICTPEYAFGIPGALKNALDWTVSSGEFLDKPIAVITAATNGEKGHAALLLVLSALSAKIDEKATLLIDFVQAKLDSDKNLKDADTQKKVKSILHAFLQEIRF